MIPAPGTGGRVSAGMGWSDARSNRVFATTLVLALAAHLFLILGVNIEPPRPDPRVTSTVEVVVLRQPESKAQVPDELNAPAQHTQSGSGSGALDSTRLQAEIDGLPEPVRSGLTSLDLDLDLEPEAPPLDVPPAELVLPPEPEPKPKPEPAPLPEPEAIRPSTQPPAPDESQVLAAESVELDAVELPPPAPLEAPPPAPVSAAAILASRSQELARLAARIEEHSAVFGSRPRRTSISSSTKEYKYAAYLEGWRRKVEQIGNINYPQEARRNQLYGNLILRTAVRADGSVEQIQVLRSSGHEVLDQAAIHIVELAAPFAPFPPDIAAETDVLDITRTWQFQRNNRLGWGN